MFSSDIRNGTNSPTSFSRMNVPIAENTITHTAAKNCHFSRVQLPWMTPAAREAGALPGSGVDDHVAVREHAGQQTAGKASEAVRVDHAERVVDVAERAQSAQVVEREVHERRGDDAEAIAPQPFT